MYICFKTWMWNLREQNYGFGAHRHIRDFFNYPMYTFTIKKMSIAPWSTKCRYNKSTMCTVRPPQRWVQYLNWQCVDITNQQGIQYATKTMNVVPQSTMCRWYKSTMCTVYHLDDGLVHKSTMCRYYQSTRHALNHKDHECSTSINNV